MTVGVWQEENYGKQDDRGQGHERVLLQRRGERKGWASVEIPNRLEGQHFQILMSMPTQMG